MCPAAGRPPIDDLTARARIRDAALTLFGEHGYSGTSIRDIARHVGVSPGLVQHHFGSKRALRDACDAHALAIVRANTERKIQRERYDADFVSDLFEATYPILKYIARGLSEEWPGSARLFDAAAEDTCRWLTAMWPDRFPSDTDTARLHAATMVCMSLGTIVLHGHLGRWLGTDPLERGNQHLAGKAMIEIYAAMGEFLATDQGRSVRDAVNEYDRNLSGGTSLINEQGIRDE